MTDRSRYVYAIAAALVLAVGIYGIRMKSRSTVDLGQKGGGIGAAIDSRLHLQQTLQEADYALSEALDEIQVHREGRALPSVPTSARKDPQARSGCEWEKGIPRSGVDLLDEFMMGSLDAKTIMRHKTLNWTDVPLCPQEVMALNLVVQGYNRVVDPLISAYRAVRVAELITLIEQGQLEPLLSERATDAEVAQLASLYEKVGDSPEKAREHAERARGQLGAPSVGSNYIRHNGKCYLHPSADCLPHSASVYGQVKFAMLEQVQVVVAWFVANGFSVDGAAVTRLCERMSLRVIE